METPINLERDVVAAVHSALADAIKTKLSGYNTPLDKLINDTVARHDGEFRAVLDKAVRDALRCAL